MNGRVIASIPQRRCPTSGPPSSLEVPVPVPEIGTDPGAFEFRTAKRDGGVREGRLQGGPRRCDVSKSHRIGRLDSIHWDSPLWQLSSTPQLRLGRLWLTPSSGCGRRIKPDRPSVACVVGALVGGGQLVRTCIHVYNITTC